MAATWAPLCGINLLWSMIPWSNDQFDRSSDQTIKDVTAASWEITFYQACRSDCEVPGESTGISIQLRWKDKVWFVCSVCIVVITAAQNIWWEVLVRSPSVADLPSRLLSTQGLKPGIVKDHSSLWWKMVLSAPPGIPGSKRHSIAFPQDLGTSMHPPTVLFHQELKDIDTF